MFGRCLAGRRQPAKHGSPAPFLIYLDLWSRDGTLDRVHHALYAECRKRGNRQASPTAAIIDSQSVKSAEKVMTQAKGSTVKKAYSPRYAGFAAPRDDPSSRASRIHSSHASKAL
jgi:hypothetical protein